MKEQLRRNTARGYHDRELRKPITAGELWTFCGYSGILRAKQRELGEPTSLDGPSSDSVRLQIDLAGPYQQIRGIDPSAT